MNSCVLTHMYRDLSVLVCLCVILYIFYFYFVEDVQKQWYPHTNKHK